MKELNLNGNDNYLINMSKVNCINGYLDGDDCWTITINFGYDNEIYIHLSDEQEFLYVMKKLKED